MTSQTGELIEEGASKAHIFNYQSAERVRDKDDRTIALYEFEL